MKSHPSLLQKAFILSFAVFLFAEDSWAQTSQFGSPITINGLATFYWDSASENGNYHTDQYTDGNGLTLSIRGKIGNSTLGEVSGAFTGYYQDNAVHSYSYSFENDAASLSYNGRNYTSVSGVTVRSIDWTNDQVVDTSYNHTYSGDGNSFNVIVGSDGNGTITGSETGYVVGGDWYVNSYSSYEWPEGQDGGTVSWFQDTYYLKQVSSSATYNSSGHESSGYSATYRNSTSDTINVSVSSPYGALGTTSISGEDAWVGSWSLANDDLSNPVFSPRSTPKFAPEVFWVNGRVMNLYGSNIDLNGNITDVFHGDNGNGGILAIYIIGNAKAYGTNQASVSLYVDASQIGNFNQSQGISSCSTETFEILTSDPNRTTPLFTPNAMTLYAGTTQPGTPFDFEGGYEDSAGNRTDRYIHYSGSVTLIGSVSSPATANVTVSFDGQAYSGTFANGVFSVNGLVIQTDPLLEGPAAFWVGGTFCPRQPDSNDYAEAATNGTTLTLSGTDPSAHGVSGTHEGTPFSGTYDAVVGGAFRLIVGGQVVAACPANSDGSLIAGGGDEIIGTLLPPAVRVQDEVWPFVGIIGTGSTRQAAYGKAQFPTASGPDSPNFSVLTIPCEGGATRAGILKEWVADEIQTGTYYVASHLFQSSGVEEGLPVPVYSVAPADSNANWLVLPPVASGLPPSFIIRGSPWWFAGIDSVTGVATYHGFYEGQHMTLGAPEAGTGARLVTLTDRVFNGNDLATHGTLSAVRGSVRLRDGTLVLSGNEVGQIQNVAHSDDYRLHTIAMDLDIVGNNLSFGLLNDDASLAGTVFQFRDDTIAASLHSTISKNQAQWLWWKAGLTPTAPSELVMHLDTNHLLKLHAPGNVAVPGVTLDPAADGVSTLRGTLRLRPGGNISMGIYTSSPTGMTAP